MILICYDGSQDSHAAIEQAGELMPNEPATVLTVWEPFTDVLARTGGLALWPDGVDFQQADAAAEQAARRRAEQGAEQARRAGLRAKPRTCARGATIAEAILSVADDIDAQAIVLGTRGLTGLKSLWLGSVSHGVVQHADRTVIIVPSPELTARRAAHRHS
jgi:nucleotide-binding universal stress UspA family protein